MVAAHPLRLIDQVAAVRSALATIGIQLTDMSRAGTLEQGLAEQADLDHAAEAAEHDRPVEITRLEGPIRAVTVGRSQPGASHFRYFLDGSQKSIPVGRIDLDPVVVALSAASILARDELGQPRLLGETLRVHQAWIVPQISGSPATMSLVSEIEATGAVVHDPCFGFDGEALGVEAGNYGRMLRLAFDLAGRLRAREEQVLVDDWTARVSLYDPEAWLVIDGPLRGNAPRAVGLVKSLQTQQLFEQEAIALFSLPPGHRTTAFRYANASGESDGRGKTMWYLRMWPAEGRDARHSLVRIETTNDVSSSAQIDELSSWLLAERLPRATNDPRWPTLIYPIHYLERILKRRLAALTTGWPST